MRSRSSSFRMHMASIYTVWYGFMSQHNAEEHSVVIGRLEFKL